MRYTKNFYNGIPIEKRKFVLDKIKRFEKQLIEVKSFRMLPKGFWVRHVEGTDSYKFRVSNGDRIVFKYGEAANELIYITYSTHDHQIRKAKSLGKDLKYIDSFECADYKIDQTNYEEDENDYILDQYIKNLYYNTYYQIKEEMLLEEDYIPLSVQSKEVQDKQYLTPKQFKCLYDKERPTIVLGCAGSGKTLIGLAKLKIEHRLGTQTIYVTNSEIMRNIASKLCIWLSEEEKHNYFYSLEELCWKILDVQKSSVIGYEQFKVWLEKKAFPLSNQISTRDIWNEISGTIKGCAIKSSPIISKDEYLEMAQSEIGKSLRNQIYVLAISYQNWLLKNAYWDENDLIKAATAQINKPLFEGVIYDEVQELNMCAIQLLSKLVGTSNKLLLLGDQYQRLGLTYNNFTFLKEQLSPQLSLQWLNKNYRNKLGVIKWNNRLKSLQQDDKLEEAVVIGKEPYYLQENENIVNKIFEVASNEIDSIIIVGSEEERKNLSMQGYNIGRVFTVEECRGLEYDRIYCYNLLQYIQNVKKYNSLYIASSRAKEKLFFVETMPNKLIDEFKGYYNCITWSELLYSFGIENNVDKWLEEAHKLEDKQQYKQAIAAYEKAGAKEEAQLCQKAYEKQLADVMLEEKGCIFDIHADNIKEEHIQEIFKKILYKGNKLKLSWILVVMFHEVDQLPMVKSVYIPQKDNYSSQFSPIIAYMKQSHICNQRLIVKCVLEHQTSDYLINVNDDKVIIREKRCDTWRLEEERRKDSEVRAINQFGCIRRTPIQEIKDQERIKIKSTEEILKDILG